MPIALPKPFLDPSEECLEAGRLSSYIDWPYEDSSRCSRTKMAQAGFFYLGNKDAVKCFSCHVKLSDWNHKEDDPLKKHTEFSPDCLFAKLGKLEKDLTIGELIDIMCHRSLTMVDQAFERFLIHEQELLRQS